MHSARLNRAQAYVSYKSIQTFLDDPILHFWWNQWKTCSLAFQMMKYQNTNFGVVMLNHLYPPFAIDEKIIN